MGLRTNFLISLLVLFSCFSSLAKERPKFTSIKAKLGNIELNLEVADTNKKRAYGLMYKKSLNKNEGMLFIYDKEQILSFWMKNTLIPLDIGFFDKNFKLVDIQTMEPQSLLAKDLKVYKSNSPAKYAIELSKSWFKNNRVSLGSVLKY